LVLFGGAFREKILFKLKEAGINIEAVVVPSFTSEKLKRSINNISKAGFHVVTTSKENLKEDLKQYAGHCLLSVGFPYLLSKDIILRHRTRLNVHPTLLPKYRGPTSGAYILINHEQFTGSTVHLLEEGMDNGDIIVQSHIPISQFDTLKSIQRKVYESEPEIVLAAIDHLEKGYPLKKQNEDEATYFPKIRTPSDSEIDPQASLIDLFDFIRACDPEEFPAFFKLNGEKVCIKLWRPDKPDCESDMI